MKSLPSVIIFVLCCAMVACTAVKPPSGASAGGEHTMSPQLTPSESLLAYYADLRKLSGAELAKETQSARRAFTKDKTPWLRLRLALLLSMPNNNARDIEQALGLLDPLTRDRQGDISANSFASLLRAFIGLRKDVDALQAANQNLKKDLNDKQQQTQDLQQKLNTLQAIEKHTTDREKASYPRKDK